MKRLGKSMSDLRQTEMLERLSVILGQIQLTQGEVTNFFIRAHQVRLEAMLVGEIRLLAACHQMTEVLQKIFFSEPELMEPG